MLRRFSLADARVTNCGRQNFTWSSIGRGGKLWVNCSFNVFVYLILVHSGCPGGLCTPCSRSAAPRWDTALHCDWAAALCGGCALALRAGRVWHSHSKSSSRPLHSPELDVGTHSEGQRVLQDILCGSKQCTETQEKVQNTNTDSFSSLCVQTWRLWANLASILQTA